MKYFSVLARTRFPGTPGGGGGERAGSRDRPRLGTLNRNHLSPFYSKRI